MESEDVCHAWGRAMIHVCLEQRSWNGKLRNLDLIHMQLQVRLLSTYYMPALSAPYMTTLDLCSILVG